MNWAQGSSPDYTIASGINSDLNSVTQNPYQFLRTDFPESFHLVAME